jgi:starch-binding outer membrane protein, SusD/RagB family
MKKTIISKIFLISILGLFLMVSCNQDFLNQKPTDELSELDVFQDPTLIESYINGVYGSIKHPFVGSNGVMRGEFVDEAHDMWYGFFEFNNSLQTSDGLQGWRYEDWASNYKSIRKCNVFFEKVDQGKFTDILVDGKTLKDRLNGEAHFLRAFLYSQLVNLYGGVPIIKTTYGLTDEFKIARNTYADCIKFIVEECDMAASLLPIENTGENYGRATKGAALALKSQVLLYAASDLHNNNPKFSGFSNPELLGYTTGTAQERWTVAKNASKAVMDMNLYSLYKPDPATGAEATQNFIDLFIADRTTEDIYVKFFIPKEGGVSYWDDNYGNNLALVSGPNGYHLWGQNAPSGNAVDAYEMNDGTKFSWNNADQAALPYANRDPRFYSSVLYEGVKWRSRPPDVAAMDPLGVIQVGTWETWDNATNAMVEVPGLDTRKSPIEPFNGGYMGYYLRKFIDPSVDGQFSGLKVPWRYIRYTEILLNYAEACIELGQDAEARTYINMIRKRAAMPDITESGAALRDRYRQERRIELYMEDKRFYDVRRWVLGPETYVDLTAVDVRYKLNPDNTTATVPTITPKVHQTRKWDDKSYFFPIMRDEVNKNDMLVQNPGY